MTSLLALIQTTHANPGAEKEIVVAIIDTGLDHRLDLFKDRLWNNPGETGLDANGRDKSSNGIDDDGNGLVDDVHGWNFLKGNHDLRDRHGHGTHISGLVIGGAGAVSALPTNIRLMTLTYYQEGASDLATLRASEEALLYAVRMGADIINFSGGGRRPSPLERKALQQAREKGILLVAAAGNEGLDTNNWPFYPASYDLPNILAVTGADAKHRLLATSNFGSRRIQTSAPGESVLSLLPGGRIGGMTGTSQATALVTHEVLRARLSRPDLADPIKMIQQVRQSGSFDPHLMGRTSDATRLDARSLRTQRNEGLDAQDRPLTWDRVRSDGVAKLSD